MPRRTKTYIGPAKTLVDGNRFEFKTGRESPVPALPKNEFELDLADIRRKVEICIRPFDELAQLDDRDQFIQDIVDQCAWARSQRLDYLVRGRRTKPNEWTAQTFVRGLASVMERHGVTPTISEHNDGKRVRKSLFLRLIPGLTRIAGFPVPSDVKGFALRAMRLEHRRYQGTNVRPKVNDF